MSDPPKGTLARLDSTATVIKRRADRCPRRCAWGGWRSSATPATDLGHQRAPTLQRHRDARTGNRSAVASEKGAWVGDALDAVVAHQEALRPRRWGRTGSWRRDRVGGRRGVSLEGEYHEVLERARSGNGTCFGDMSHENGGHGTLLGHADQGTRCITHRVTHLRHPRLLMTRPSARSRVPRGRGRWRRSDPGLQTGQSRRPATGWH